jgi:hypothetical protein
MEAVIRRPSRSILVAVVLTALVALVGAPGDSAGAAGAAASATETTQTDVDSRDTSECISALPRPGCDRRDTDAMQVAVLLVMTAGVGLIGWRIGRAVRARDRTNTPPTST